MSDDEMEDYGFEYSDDDAADENVDIENQYYNSKGGCPRGRSACGQPGCTGAEPVRRRPAER